MKCLGLPLGQATLSGEAQPCAGSQAPPHTHTVRVPGLLETEPLKILSTHATPAPALPAVGCPASAPRWLQSWLCPLMLHPAPVSGSMATLTTSVILRWLQPTPSPRCRAREPRSDPRSHGAARPPRAKGPAAAPLRPGFQARNQLVWAWQWTYLSYCEVLFMKNLEGEGARPQESGVHPFPHPTRTPAPWATLAHPQGTLTPGAAPLQNPALLLQGLSRPTFALVKGQSVPRGPSCPVLGPLGVGAEGCHLLSQGGVAWEMSEELTLFSQ